MKLKFLKIYILKNENSSIKCPIIYSTSFLSFSTDNKIAENLGYRRLSSKENNTVIIKLNALEHEYKKEIMETNAFLKQISAFHKENEVLFFPFSSFELVDIEDLDGGTLITLNYSLRFKDKVQNCSYFNENWCLIF